MRTRSPAAVMLVGLPQATFRECRSVIDELDGYRSFGAGASAADDGIYNSKHCSQLLRGISEFSIPRHIQKIKKNARTSFDTRLPDPAPRAIYLLYVPSPDFEVLLRRFDFFAFPIALAPLEGGVSWRHDVRRSRILVQRSTNLIRRPNESLQLVRACVPSGQNSALKLPARNFFLERTGRTIKTLFEDVRSGREGFEVPDRRVARRRLGRRRCPLDAKERFFPPDPKPHGLLRPHEDLRKPRTDDELRRIMNGLYRFGQPLNDGYHFDVQRQGRSLTTEEFHCSARGIIHVTGSHANVYPNDYVRR